MSRINERLCRVLELLDIYGSGGRIRFQRVGIILREQMAAPPVDSYRKEALTDRRNDPSSIFTNQREDDAYPSQEAAGARESGIQLRTHRRARRVGHGKES